MSMSGFFLQNVSIQKLISFLFLKGDVHGNVINVSIPPLFFAQLTACLQASQYGVSSLESSFGLLNGTSAPTDFAIDAILDESVDTMTLFILELLKAHLIEVTIRGSLLNLQIFLFF